MGSTYHVTKVSKELKIIFAHCIRIIFCSDFAHKRKVNISSLEQYFKIRKTGSFSAPFLDNHCIYSFGTAIKAKKCWANPQGM